MSRGSYWRAAVGSALVALLIVAYAPGQARLKFRRSAASTCQASAVRGGFQIRESKTSI